MFTFEILSAIEPDPNQPRSTMGDLTELALSIQDKGVLEPVLVRSDPADETGFLLISGERRYRAALEAGLFEIPAIVMEVSDEEALEIALVENLQRQDLSSFEEAEGYERLASAHGYTHERIASAVSFFRLRPVPPSPPSAAPLPTMSMARTMIWLAVLAITSPGWTWFWPRARPFEPRPRNTRISSMPPLAAVD